MVMESDGNVGRALKNGGRIKKAATEEEKEEDEEKDEEEDEEGRREIFWKNRSASNTNTIKSIKRNRRHRFVHSLIFNESNKIVITSNFVVMPGKRAKAKNKRFDSFK